MFKWFLVLLFVLLMSCVSNPTPPPVGVWTLPNKDKKSTSCSSYTLDEGLDRANSKVVASAIIQAVEAFGITVEGSLNTMTQCIIDTGHLETCTEQVVHTSQQQITGQPHVQIIQITYPESKVKMKVCAKVVVRQQQTQPANPLSFKISYLYRAGGRGAFQHFRDGSRLQSGDSLKLLFTPTQDNVYVYIFMVDSDNNLARLFPTDDFIGAATNNKNPVKKGVEYFVPAADKSFKLDNNTGEETIYFISTRQPDDVLERRYQDILLAQRSQNAKQIAATQNRLLDNIYTDKQRLIQPELIEDVLENAPVTFTDGGQTFSILPHYLKNMCEGCVYRVTFQHR